MGIANNLKKSHMDILDAIGGLSAEEVGNIKTYNMVILSAYTYKTGAVYVDALKNSIAKVYLRANEAMVKMNKKAINKGTGPAIGMS